MFSKISFYTIVCFSFIIGSLNAQDCDITLQGYVYDSGTREPLEYANILVEESASGSVTDSTGFFIIKNLCPSHIHISFSHIGCESQRLHLDIERDTIITYYLDHTDHVLHEVSITDRKSPTATQSYESISKQYISDNASDNLSDLVATIPGVSSLKNGSGIAKPIVHGLYGNRLTILNNGVVQAGQQWGNDHSPEIDPLVANNISVIKGVNAITYLNGQMGAIVLVEPGSINQDPHAHGKVNYFYDTNGRSHGVNAQLQKYASQMAWKINGTFKKSGDNSSPDYYLNNTGSQEANISIQLEKKFSDKHTTKLYLSSFNADLGVLRGSHIGNLTDLENAIGRDEPFFTEENFSYSIEAPKQKVNHHLFKLSSQYFISDSQWLNVNLSSQANFRKEFDVRRSGRSEIPALSLRQYLSIFDVQYNQEYSNDVFLKSGLQASIIDNTNIPETGILPLIPDYVSYNGGVYTTLAKNTKTYTIEAGLRYDYINQEAATISGTVLREIIRYNDIYHNLSTSIGWKYSIADRANISLNTAYAMRNPAINERFSFGLHQGVGGIEEGDIDITNEKSWKSTLSLSNNAASPFYIESVAYFHSIQDYIFLQPQDEFRLTIRGAFPVFKYEQTDANIYGLDIFSRYKITDNIETTLSYSYIKGIDRSQDIALIYMPANNLTAQLSYALVRPITILGKSIENFKFSIDNKHVFRRADITEDQDFLLPPDAYNLIGLTLSGDIPLKSIRLRITAGIDNLMNSQYRDYLNRQRYFADDIGRSVRGGVSVRF
jgi:iron complex outermembrane recepter protein